MPFFTPLPVPACGETAEVKGSLTDEQEKKYQEVLSNFNLQEYKLPEVGSDVGQLSEAEKFWLTKECFLRYLRATKWDVRSAISRVEDTLRWRREYGFYDALTPDHVEPESVTGKEIIFGYDTQRRPALYMLPSRQNTDGPERQLQYAVWMLERTIDLMGPGVESLDLMINFADRSKNPSIGTARSMLHILQSHYPERLGLALIINVPFLVNAFFKIILPFVDPITRLKIKFNPKVIEEGIMAKDQVMKEWWGGDVEFEWDHAKYWPALLKMCDERRAAQMQRWRELGGVVGISEWEIKTIEISSPAPASEPAPEPMHAPELAPSIDQVDEKITSPPEVMEVIPEDSQDTSTQAVAV